eukprot:CAMPEP_0174272412 /NCGR_PEP_ID=MMETSP0439-20130205/51184_1 /TAXON_ID=0 /ORGANISM="Stereomyxa ramosa, Strain Chinc5" /LENGTH=260 /DNA_ID=CAMNT_0015362969 /DNA_START=275 /DNA_END=1054 /DNA_ORIENTATION=+
MKRELATNWDVRAKVLHDRPPAFFKHLNAEEAHHFFERISEDFLDTSEQLGIEVNDDQTLFTEFRDGQYQFREDRAGLVISSTSWTPDEDFSILLDAIVLLENIIHTYEAQNPDQTFPKLLFVITGKGPEKEHYKQLISTMKFTHCKIITMWLEPDDYPKILGASDLGISLHYSSSGLDLPMKVVDMFGCELPVCAVKFDTLNELVQDGENGLHFSRDDKEELANQLFALFRDFPNKKNLDAITGKSPIRWSENWKNKAW